MPYNVRSISADELHNLDCIDTFLSFYIGNGDRVDAAVTLCHNIRTGIGAPAGAQPVCRAGECKYILGGSRLGGGRYSSRLCGSGRHGGGLCGSGLNVLVGKAENFLNRLERSKLLMLGVHVELLLVIADKFNRAAVFNVRLIGICGLNHAALKDVRVVFLILIVNFFCRYAEFFHQRQICFKLEITDIHKIGEIILQLGRKHLRSGLVCWELTLDKLARRGDVCQNAELGVILPVSKVVAFCGVRGVLSGLDRIIQNNCVAETINVHINVRCLITAVCRGRKEHAEIYAGLRLHVTVVSELHFLALRVNLGIVVHRHGAVDVIGNRCTLTCVNALTGLCLPAGIKELFGVAVNRIGIAVNRHCVVQLIDFDIAPVSPCTVSGEFKINLLLADSRTFFLSRSRKSTGGNRKSRHCH